MTISIGKACCILNAKNIDFSGFWLRKWVPNGSQNDLKNQLLRTLADNENNRRRYEKEKEDLSAYIISNFAKEIIKNSKVKVFLVKDQYLLAKFLKQNLSTKQIVIGMGAGSISSWMRELPKLIS